MVQFVIIKYYTHYTIICITYPLEQGSTLKTWSLWLSVREYKVPLRESGQYSLRSMDKLLQ